MEFGFYGSERTADGNKTSTYNSWAQHAEESYQLQLALALRLSSQAALANDPNFLDFKCNDHHVGAISSFSDSPQAVSHRFWVNGSLSYFDRIPDGFYIIHGVDPYAWTLSIDQREIGAVPSFESLKAIDPCADLSIKVVAVDRFSDPGLKELLSSVISLSSSWITTKDVINQLANLVCNRLGGITSTEDEAFDMCWSKCTDVLKSRLGSVVLPMGSLPVGLCTHRAILFKVLADSVNLPCRIAKGCKYCRRDVASACLVRIDNEREFLVDLFGKPGTLSHPDSSLNCTSLILVSSPLSHPNFKAAQIAEDLRTLAKLFFFDSQSLNLAFDDGPAGNEQEALLQPSMERISGSITNGNNLHVPSSSNDSNGTPPIPPGPILPSGHREAYMRHVWSDPFLETTNSSITNSSSKLHLEEEDLDIPWSEIDLKDKIGEGSFGIVHRALWRGSDVAVKILIEHDYHAERFNKFLHEVAMMKRLRHPNIALFMGAVTQPPHLSIVTEHLSRGSLHNILHMPNARLVLDEKRRLNMAYDLAKGMNYLHQLRPPIVHRDLKSLNLLVDSTYTVKVGDFGLSHSKARTYLSSKAAAGTPEWMAPEVLRNDPSNEKADIYSFGVILWELMTFQRPWRSLNQTQVVEAVGFKGQMLEIPNDINPSVAALIDKCLTIEPSRRPSFSYIMGTLECVINDSSSRPPNLHLA